MTKASFTVMFTLQIYCNNVSICYYLLIHLYLQSEQNLCPSLALSFFVYTYTYTYMLAARVLVTTTMKEARSFFFPC